jgi:hypothetical protein
MKKRGFFWATVLESMVSGPNAFRPMARLIHHSRNTWQNKPAHLTVKEPKERIRISTVHFRGLPPVT